MAEFILLEKNGEKIEVHPLSLKNHLELGWKVVEKPEETAQEETVVDEKKSAKPRRK